MRLLAINGSPRKTKNTGSLLQSLVEGAASKGAEVELIHLIDLQCRGCISCFQCKLPDSTYYGRCAVQDDLAPVLQKAHEADVVVLGTPFYFSCETGQMRAFMERFWFQYYLYTAKKPPLSPPGKRTALIYTMNVRAEDLIAYGKQARIDNSKGVMERLFGSCELLLCTDTKQFDDYNKYEVDHFDVESKLKRHEEVFPQELQQARALGERLVR